MSPDAGYAVVVLRLERMATGTKLLVRATVQVGDGRMEAEDPVVIDADAVGTAFGSLLERVSLQLVGS